VKRILIATTFLASLPAAAVAREPVGDDPWTPSSFERVMSLAPSESEPAIAPLPGSLKDDDYAAFSIGPAAGYLVAKDADRGTWFGGAKARLRVLRFLAAEASITFHQNRYNDGDIVVTQYPVQLTAMLYIIPVGPIRPYILGGVGWYYTRTDFRDNLDFIDDETDNFFGFHLGAGAELMLGPSVSLDADVRYIFVDADEEDVVDGDFNYWQIAFGINFHF
jgi:opacity protein-like surface antigen